MILETRYGHRRQPTGARRVLRRIAIVVGVIAASFGIGYLLAVRVFFPEPPPPAGGVAVPDLTGMTESQARRRLEDVGLVLGETIGIAHASMPAGIIVGQSPLEGQQLRRGASVGAGVSTGRATAPVPDVIGLGEETAAALLARLGFDAEVRRQHASALAGQVIGTEPAPGVGVLLPSQVNVYVSAGPQPGDTLESGGDSIPERS